jgi:hypothetical protein
LLYRTPSLVTPIQVKHLLERSRERIKLTALEKRQEKEDAERNDKELLLSLYPERKRAFK